MWRDGTCALVHNVIAVARMVWFVYTLERAANVEISFIMPPSLFDPRGLLSYQTRWSSITDRVGYWKSASHFGFNFCKYIFRQLRPSKSGSSDVEYILASFSELLLSSIPPGWFFVASSWVIKAYSWPLSSLQNWKLCFVNCLWPSHLRRHRRV